MSLLSDCDGNRTTSRSQLYKCAKTARVQCHSKRFVLRHWEWLCEFFQDSDSDSAGVVKMSILSSSLRDFCSARLLNSCCSTGAAQPPTADSCGRTWQPLTCESV